MPNPLVRTAPNQPTFFSNHFPQPPAFDYRRGGSEAAPMVEIGREPEYEYSSPFMEALLEGRLSSYLWGGPSKSENSKLEGNNEHSQNDGFLDEPKNRESRMIGRTETKEPTPYCNKRATDSFKRALGDEITVRVEGLPYDIGPACYGEKDVSGCFKRMGSVASVWGPDGEPLIPENSTISCSNIEQRNFDEGYNFDGLIFTGIDSNELGVTFGPKNSFKEVQFYSSVLNAIFECGLDIGRSFQVFNSTAIFPFQACLDGGDASLDLSYYNPQSEGATTLDLTGSNLNSLKISFYQSTQVVILDDVSTFAFEGDERCYPIQPDGSTQCKKPIYSLKNFTASEDFRSQVFSSISGEPNKVYFPADCSQTTITSILFSPEVTLLECTNNDRTWCENADILGRNLNRWPFVNPSWCSTPDYRQSYNSQLALCSSEEYPFVGPPLSEEGDCRTTVNSTLR